MFCFYFFTKSFSHVNLLTNSFICESPRIDINKSFNLFIGPRIIFVIMGNKRNYRLWTITGMYKSNSCAALILCLPSPVKLYNPSGHQSTVIMCGQTKYTLATLAEYGQISISSALFPAFHPSYNIVDHWARLR